LGGCFEKKIVVNFLFRVVTVKEQELREKMLTEKRDITTVITKEEQDFVKKRWLKRDLYHKKMG